MVGAVARLRDQVDHVVLLLHWGLEYSHLATPEQVAFAHQAIDSGVSVILGNHSHSLQGIEKYRVCVIAYSLANITDSPVDWQGPRKRYRTPLTHVDPGSVLLCLRFDKKQVEIVGIIPLWLAAHGRPIVADAARGEKIDRRVFEAAGRGRPRILLGGEGIKSLVEAPLADRWANGNLWDKVKGFRSGELLTLYLLVRGYLRIKLSRPGSKWMLVNPWNDTRPMPSRRPVDSDGP